VRLLTGTLELHHELEHELARSSGQEGAATFASGYDANIAAITSLFGPGDVAILDQYAHQSIHDGVRMAGCESAPVPPQRHERPRAAAAPGANRGAQRILVAVDSVFSMDGDQAPIADLIELKEKYGAFLLVDEAHSLGAVGATGRGICEEQGIDPAASTSSPARCRRAIPSSGGFVAGSRGLKIYIQHGSAPYMFSAAMTPANAAASLEALRIVQDEPQHMERLRANTRIMRDGLARLGFDTGARPRPSCRCCSATSGAPTASPVRCSTQGIFVSAVVVPGRLARPGAAAPVRHGRAPPGALRAALRRARGPPRRGSFLSHPRGTLRRL
jgi:7-keto-8-aminopelargonate synthetase-like enzyme